MRNWPTALERTITLAIIDDAWKEHLRAMDDLKHSVQTAVYEQKDPLVIYKTTAFELFSQYGCRSEQGYCFLPLSCRHSRSGKQAATKEGREQKTDMSKMRVRKEELVTAGGGDARDDADRRMNIMIPGLVKQDPLEWGQKWAEMIHVPVAAARSIRTAMVRNNGKSKVEIRKSIGTDYATAPV